MEDTLGLTAGEELNSEECLNPCSNGRYSRSINKIEIDYEIWS